MARKKRKGEPPVEELLAPDVFETAGASGASWFEKNFKYLVAAVVVILGSILAYEYISASRARGQAAMTTELNEALDAFGEATDMRTVLTSTVPTAVTSAYRESQKKLADFRAKYSGEEAAALAGLYEAELWRRLDEPAKAAPLYEAYLEKLGSDASLAFIAHEGAGYAYEALGQLDQALAHFEEMARYDFARGYALKHQARVLEAKKETERARAIYEQLAELDATSPLKTFAEERLRVLE